MQCCTCSCLTHCVAGPVLHEHVHLDAVSCTVVGQDSMGEVPTPSLSRAHMNAPAHAPDHGPAASSQASPPCFVRALGLAASPAPQAPTAQHAPSDPAVAEGDAPETGSTKRRGPAHSSKAGAHNCRRSVEAWKPRHGRHATRTAAPLLWRRRRTVQRLRQNASALSPHRCTSVTTASQPPTKTNLAQHPRCLQMLVHDASQADGASKLRPGRVKVIALPIRGSLCEA
eukprot:366119-Chlamydomonas_euryale.AAC.20